MLRAYFNLLQWDLQNIKTQLLSGLDVFRIKAGKSGAAANEIDEAAERIRRELRGTLEAVIFETALPDGRRCKAAYALARADGVRPVTNEPPARVKLVRAIEHPKGTIEWFDTPDGVREWHQNGQLYFADRWGAPVEPAYYELAQTRGLSVRHDPPFEPNPDYKADPAADAYRKMLREEGGGKPEYGVLEETRRMRLIAALRFRHLMRYAPDVEMGVEGGPVLSYKVVFANGKATARPYTDPGADGVIEQFGPEDLRALVKDATLAGTVRRDLARALDELDPSDADKPKPEPF